MFVLFLHWSTGVEHRLASESQTMSTWKMWQIIVQIIELQKWCNKDAKVNNAKRKGKENCVRTLKNGKRVFMKELKQSRRFARALKAFYFSINWSDHPGWKIDLKMIKKRSLHALEFYNQFIFLISFNNFQNHMKIFPFKISIILPSPSNSRYHFIQSNRITSNK